jgi:tRNA threonylcarbamoyladenosine biosynthesis protein TsaE
MGPASSAWVLRSGSAAATERLGRLLGQSARGGAVIALYGDLGAGKTVFVRGLAAGLGASTEQVSSPTFVLINEYAGRLRLAHADLYRMDRPEAVDELGLWDYGNERTVLAVEWADKAGASLPSDRLEIRLSHRSPRSRDIAVTATGPAAQNLLARWRRGYRARRPRTARSA